MDIDNAELIRWHENAFKRTAELRIDKPDDKQLVLAPLSQNTCGIYGSHAVAQTAYWLYY